jgi:dihydroxy-acid dehydratase
MTTETPAAQLNRFSQTLTQKMDNPAAKAMLYAVGLSTDDMQKPQIGIASTGYERVTPATCTSTACRSM